jgi:hypothetical protein
MIWTFDNIGFSINLTFDNIGYSINSSSIFWDSMKSKSMFWGDTGHSIETLEKLKG